MAIKSVTCKLLLWQVDYNDWIFNCIYTYLYVYLLLAHAFRRTSPCFLLVFFKRNSYQVIIKDYKKSWEEGSICENSSKRGTGF